MCAQTSQGRKAPYRHGEHSAACPTTKGQRQRLRRLLPAFFADYWDREQEFAQWRAAIRCAYVSSGSSPFDNGNGLGSIKSPTLVIVGRYDFICGLRWARDLHNGIAGAELLILGNSGHLGHLEEPDTFLNAVVAFTRSARDCFAV
jgi:proline iminopeptidase